MPAGANAQPTPVSVDAPLPRASRPADRPSGGYRLSASSQAVLMGVGFLQLAGCATTHINTVPAEPVDLDALTEATSQPTLTTKAEVQALLKKIVAEQYPKLVGKELRVKTFTSDDTYFQSRPQIGSVLNPFGKTCYNILVNEKVFEAELPMEAAEAILAHELGHTLSYVEGGIGGMLGTLLNQGHKHNLAKEERHTDLEAIERGYADGLIKYREWIYPRLSPSDLTDKQRTYLSPDEIRTIADAVEEDPTLMAAFKSNPPTSLEAVHKIIAAHP